MKRFDREEMKKCLEPHDSRRVALGFNRDPDGLHNVLQSRGLVWLNEGPPSHRKTLYERLSSLHSPAGLGARALDVGCGAGRWRRFSAGRGYEIISEMVCREDAPVSHAIKASLSGSLEDRKKRFAILLGRGKWCWRERAHFHSEVS